MVSKCSLTYWTIVWRSNDRPTMYAHWTESQSFESWVEHHGVMR